VSSTDTIRMLSKSIRSSWSSFRRRVALQAITRKECFARLDYIDQLSIADVMVLFRYATDVNQVDFDKKRFMVEQSQLLQAMVTAIVSRIEYSWQMESLYWIAWLTTSLYSLGYAGHGDHNLKRKFI
jgi:hypothetical protein